MIQQFPSENLSALSFSFYFENLCSGVPVLDYLKKLGHNGTGTIRERRIPHNCPLPTNKEMNKSYRGRTEPYVLKDHNISVIKWTDNKCVFMASTIHGKDPVSKASRFSRLHRKRIMVDRLIC